MKHIPVLLNEVVASFKDLKIRTFVDGTVGLGGHAKELLSSHEEIERFIGLDQDIEALKIAEKKLSSFGRKVELKNKNFSKLDEVLNLEKIKEVDGFLFDIGVSSIQLDEAERGFSFSKDAFLDMRMDRSSELTAEKIINNFSEKELEKIFFEYGEELLASKIARKIVEERQEKRISTTRQLADLIEKVVYKKKKIHPATLVFQALRIFVNDELNVLKKGINLAIDFLSSKGRIAVICFHSLEDRIVKQMFSEAAKKTHVNIYKQPKPLQRLKIITKQPITATREEMQNNPRSRSAKLRVAEKT